MGTWECDNCGAYGPRRTGPCPRCRLSSPKRTAVKEPPEGSQWLPDLVADLDRMRADARVRVLDAGEVFGAVKVTSSVLDGQGWQQVSWESPYAKGTVSTPMYQ